MRRLLVALPVALVFAAPAQAAVTASNVNTPADPYFGFADDANVSNEITVTGTSNGTTGDVIDLKCYSNGNILSPSPGQDIAVNADGTWSSQLDLEDISDRGYGCILRAVPDSGPDNVAPFKGPRMLITWFRGPESGGDYSVHGGGDVTYDVYADVQNLRGNWYTYEVGDDPLYQGGPVNPSNLFSTSYWNGYYLIETGGDWENDNNDGTATPVQVDGGHAYTTPQLRHFDFDGGGPEGFTLPAGTGSVEVTRSHNASNGDFTITERYVLYRCNDNAVFPATAASCDTVTPTGVRVDRTKRFVDSGRTVFITDQFVSTDGGAHSVSAEYYDSSSASGYPEYRLPGETNYSMRMWGDVFNWTSPGTMFIREAEYGDSSYSGAAAITNEQQPNATVWDDDDETYTTFSLSVPAGGSATVQRRYDVGQESTTIEKTLGAAADAASAPQVAISAPANGAATSEDNVLVTGTASDNQGVATLKVNGVTVPVNSDGTWAHRVDLAMGANVITATAADASGLTATTSTTVNRVAPAATVCTVPTVKKKSRLAAARKALTEANCGTATKRLRHRKVKKGRVIGLNAKPGQLFKAGTKITIKVSSGKPKRKKG
jgi:hypothetical protein